MALCRSPSLSPLLSSWSSFVSSRSRSASSFVCPPLLATLSSYPYPSPCLVTTLCTPYSMISIPCSFISPPAIQPRMFLRSAAVVDDASTRRTLLACLLIPVASRPKLASTSGRHVVILLCPDPRRWSELWRVFRHGTAKRRRRRGCARARTCLVRVVGPPSRIARTVRRTGFAPVVLIRSSLSWPMGWPRRGMKIGPVQVVFARCTRGRGSRGRGGL
jgi:hypothetical protein